MYLSSFRHCFKFFLLFISKILAAEAKSDRQLQTVLNQCLNKFLGYHLSECGEEIILDISEVLFNELAYIYMIDDYEVIDEDQNKVDEAIIQNMVNFLVSVDLIEK